jgi:hypothetical protein
MPINLGPGARIPRPSRMMDDVRLLGSRNTALALLVAMLLAGCSTTISGTAIPASRADSGQADWVLSTPPGLVPTALSAGVNGVLVGGATPGDPHQPLIAVVQGGTWQNVPAAAATAYGGRATILHLAMSGEQVAAMGTVTGGAHLNPRWSAWIGTTAGVTEEPQTVETFGGPAAGGITGLVGGGDPMIIGTWSMAPGVTGVASWRHQDRTWLRQPSPPVLAGAATELTTATATAATGSGVVISGLTTTFRHGVVHQQAVLWVARGADGWARFDLDSSDQDSAATGVACAAESCLAVGRLGDRLAAWRVAIGGTSVVTGIEEVPDRRIDHYTGQPRVGVDATAAVIAPGTSGEVLVTGPTGWTSLPAPAGEQRQVGVNGGKLYLLLRPSTGQQAVYSRDLN